MPNSNPDDCKNEIPAGLVCNTVLLLKNPVTVPPLPSVKASNPINFVPSCENNKFADSNK